MRTTARLAAALACSLLVTTAAVSHAVRGTMPGRPAVQTSQTDDGRMIAADGRALRGAINGTSLTSATLNSARQRGGVRLAAMQSFERTLGAAAVLWDEGTGVPLRIAGAGQPVADAMANAGIAERAAREFIERNLAALAPGATLADLVLLHNSLNPSGDLRTVAFAQHAAGLPVVGAAVYVSFKANRLFAAGSTAMPHVRAFTLAATSGAATPSTVAMTQWLTAAGGRNVVVTAASQRVVLPLIGPASATGAAVISYVVADQQLAAGDAGARWLVWSDPVSGQPLARQSLRRNGQGVVAYDVPKRSPIFGTAPKPALFATHQLSDGQNVTANDVGLGLWTGTVPLISPGLSGPLVSVVNNQSGPATVSLPLLDGATTLWTSTVEAEQAQLAGFVAANEVKVFVKQFLNPSLPYLDAVLTVVVNETDGGPGNDCNAYSTGDDIHFFPRSERCENSGLLADVVHHEFGHSLHFNSLTPGVGNFDSAASEGLSDFLALAMSDDPVLGLGFFLTRPEIPVRDLDPAYREKRAPDDLTGESHADGEILAGSLWDLRKALIARLGKEAGVARALKIFYAIMQRGNGIETAFNEALLADDDNGNLADGTPNQCAIRAAFGHHGLADGQPLAFATVAPPTRTGFELKAAIAAGTGAAPGCADPTMVSGTVTWRVRGKTDAASSGTIAMTAAGLDASATLPSVLAGSVLQYQVALALDDGSSLRFPNNAADPFYEFYVGDVTPIWCAEFEGSDAPALTLAGDWQLGTPMGPGAGGVGGDPAAAFAGTGVLGNNLMGGGLHSSITTATATLPLLNVSGYRDVRLQFRRWLNVDDGNNDQAAVRINGTVAWTNPARNATTMLEKFIVEPRVLRDLEWRDIDFDLGDPANGVATDKIALELISDNTNELGGWTVDHLCVVGVASVCGDGLVDASEACDDGNTADGDQCTATCQLPADDGGCCSVSERGATGPALLALATFGVWGVGRRRRLRIVK